MSCASTHYHRALRHVPGVRSDSYLCPVCLREISRYRLLDDINGIPRNVDTAGFPCGECMDRMHDLIDDGR